MHDYDAHYFYNRVTGETAWKLPDFDNPAGGDASSSSPGRKDKKKDKKSKKKDKKKRGVSALSLIHI